jgi:hypothetical protein
MSLHHSKVKALGTLLIAIILLIVCVFFLTNLIAAQTKNYFGIIIQPAIDDYTVNPRDVISGKVVLTNDIQERNPIEPTFTGEETVTYYPSTILFKQDGETGNPVFYQNTTDPDGLVASRWITFDSTSYSMDYAEAQTVNYTITIPTGAEPGGHYVALVFSEQKPDSFTEQVSVNKAISELVFITVSGEIRSSGDLLEFKSRKTIYEWPPLDFYVRYKNTGNVHETIKGEVIIHRGDINKPITKLDVNPDKNIVLATSVRTFDIRKPDGFIYVEDGIPRVNFNKLSQVYIGKYTATLQLEHMYHNQMNITTVDVTFWVIPWKLVLVIILILLLIITFILTRRERRRRRKKDLMYKREIQPNPFIFNQY